MEEQTLSPALLGEPCLKRVTPRLTDSGVLAAEVGAAFAGVSGVPVMAFLTAFAFSLSSFLVGSVIPHPLIPVLNTRYVHTQ